LKGDKREHRRNNLNHIIASTQHLVIDQSEAVTYAKLRTSLELAGTPLGGNDTWIVAEALHHNLVLITDNSHEFDRVAGLRVENWT
jgi:tRNA(fMet)-specific endonuclease VapC